jgi:hypothetical protein
MSATNTLISGKYYSRLKLGSTVCQMTLFRHSKSVLRVSPRKWTMLKSSAGKEIKRDLLTKSFFYYIYMENFFLAF